MGKKSILEEAAGDAVPAPIHLTPAPQPSHGVPPAPSGIVSAQEAATLCNTTVKEISSGSAMNIGSMKVLLARLMCTMVVESRRTNALLEQLLNRR